MKKRVPMFWNGQKTWFFDEKRSKLRNTFSRPAHIPWIITNFRSTIFEKIFFYNDAESSGAHPCVISFFTVVQTFWATINLMEKCTTFFVWSWKQTSRIFFSFDPTLNSIYQNDELVPKKKLLQYGAIWLGEIFFRGHFYSGIPPKSILWKKMKKKIFLHCLKRRKNIIGLRGSSDGYFHI